MSELAFTGQSTDRLHNEDAMRDETYNIPHIVDGMITWGLLTTQERMWLGLTTARRQSFFGQKWTCPGLVESMLLTSGLRSRTGPGFGNVVEAPAMVVG